MEISSKHFLSQAIRANELKFVENVHHPRYVTCHRGCLVFGRMDNKRSIAKTDLIRMARNVISICDFIDL